LLSRCNHNVFQNVLDKVGLPKVLTAMSLPVTKIQQGVITMFIRLMTSEARACRFLQDKVDKFSAICITVSVAIDR
jgi:serine/threonine-protein kinase ULK4